jgi:two-component system sensor kinase FixL
MRRRSLQKSRARSGRVRRPARTQDAAPSGATSIKSDITEHKRTVRALQQSEERFRGMFERSPIGMAVTDLSGSFGAFVKVNAAFCRMLGYSEDELTRLTIGDVTHPDDRAESLRLSGQLRDRAIESFSIEKRYVAKDGNAIWANTTAMLLPSEAGGGTYSLAMVEDVTEDRRAVEAVRESEEKYRSLVERANDGIIIVQDGVVTLANERMAEMWGGPAEATIGSRFTDFVHPDEVPKVLDRHKRRMAGEAVPAIYESVFLRRDGSPVPVELNAGVIPYRGRPADLVIVRDITERKRTEDALAVYQQHLQELVEERTRELGQAQDALVTQAKLAALGRIAGSVAHELRNPLSAIRNAAYYLKRTAGDKLEGKPARHLEIINEQIERSNRVVTVLLDFVRGREAKPVSCRVEELLAAARRDAGLLPTVEVSIDIAPRLPAVRVDPVQLVQVFVNLLDNASDAMKGHGRITVTARTAGDRVEVAVSDSGPGIRPEHMARLFEPLFSTKDVGTGLGLAISRDLVEASGGSIAVESPPGQGARFTVSLLVASD